MNTLYLLAFCFTLILAFALLILVIGLFKDAFYEFSVNQDIVMGACFLVFAILILGISVILGYFSISVLRIM